MLVITYDHDESLYPSPPMSHKWGQNGDKPGQLLPKSPLNPQLSEIAPHVNTVPYTEMVGTCDFLSQTESGDSLDPTGGNSHLKRHREKFKFHHKWLLFAKFKDFVNICKVSEINRECLGLGKK